MESKLTVPVFSISNSTIVRSFTGLLALGRQRIVEQVHWRLAPQRAMDRAVKTMLTPPPHSFPDEELHLMEYASQVRVPFGRGHLVGWRWGNRRAATVLVMHGWGGRGTQFRHFIPTLRAAGFSVVSFDAPGHGMSGKSESSLPDFVRALEAVVDHLGDVHALVGHSLGAAAVGILLARRPCIAASAVLIAAPASLEQSSQRLGRLLGRPQAMIDAMQARIERKFGRPLASFDAERNGGETPILVIHDRNDREVISADAKRYVAAWPRARLMETAGLGHRRILNDPTVIESSVDFIKGARP